MEKEAGLQIKVQAHEKTEARAKPAKAQAAADAPPLTEETDLMPSKVAAEAKTGAEAKTADETKASGKASNHASITAASMLAQICERAFMEHQLSARHFAFYHFWVFFVPLNFLIAATSILAFIGGDSALSKDSSINIIVGCIAAFSVFWNSCDCMLSYKSRADMHKGAKMVCKELLADLDFALIKYRSFSEAERLDPKHDPMPPQALADIKIKIDQVQESCTSAVPDAINQVFKEMNSLVVFDLDIKGLANGSSEDVQLVRLGNVLLNKEITRSWLWPVKLPGAAVCQKARNALVKEYKTDSNDLSEIRKSKKADAEAATAASVPAATPAATLSPNDLSKVRKRKETVAASAPAAAHGATHMV